MRLVKKINNNVALGIDDSGRDVVVFGKGVGFKHMPYDITPTDEVQRIFFDVSRGMAGTLAGLSDNVLLAASDIVDLAKMELECKLNPNLVVTLADHIQFAIERRREGIDVQNPLQNEVAFVYPNELRIGRTGVAMVNARVEDADLPESEACSIALHIVNGEMGGAGDTSSIDLVMETARIMKEVTKIIESELGVTLDRRSYAYNRFVGHFRYLVARLSHGESEQTKNSSLFEQAAKEFPDIYSCVEKIQQYLADTYGWSCSNEELLYLMMHVNRLVTAR